MGNRLRFVVFGTARFFWRWRLTTFIVVVGLLYLSQSYTLGINMSNSLPENIFLVDKTDKTVKPGDYVAFRWHGGGPYPEGLTFIKIIKGMEKDVVKTDQHRGFYINNKFISRAKERTKKGEPLALGPTGEIPPGKMYVSGKNPDSLDSRYNICGWIPTSHIIGKAIPIF